MRQIHSIPFLLACLLLNSFTIYAQPDISKWVVVGQKNVVVKKIPPATKYNINVSTRYKLPGKEVVKKISVTPSVSMAEEWAGYWNPRVEMQSYLDLISNAGGFLLMPDDVKAVYPLSVGGKISYLSVDVKRGTAIADGVVSLVRWIYTPTTAGRFTMANSVAGYLQVLYLPGGAGYTIKLTKSRGGAAEEFMWVVVPVATPDYYPVGLDIADGYIPGRLYKLVLYHPASKKIIAYNKEAGKTGLVLGTFEDYLGGRLPATWDAEWELVSIGATGRPVPGRFVTKMMAVAEWDMDGDGRSSAECGGDDCDDNDARRFPGNTEVCDADGVDEDCDEATFGTRDDDEDGFIDDLCYNGNNSGTDCDDKNALINKNSGLYLFMDDSTIASAACNSTIYRLPKEQIAIRLPNGTAHVSLRPASPMIVPKQ